MAHVLLLCAKTSKDFVACTGLFAGEPAPTGGEPVGAGLPAKRPVQAYPITARRSRTSHRWPRLRRS
ncbi:hypothetical protein C1882_02520 [Pseudomonas sp. FW305-E2]|nr:hypothetical protein C1882_02520 [Pseudomonas sp. FW305-E2]